MAIDRFTPRSLSAAVQTLGDGRQNFLQNAIFRRGRMHPTDTIDFGVLSVPARVANYRRAGEPAEAIDKASASSKTVKAPKIRLKKVFDEAFHASLNPALNSYLGPYTDPNDQIAEKVQIEQAELRMRIDRTLELQCAQALLLGVITLTFEDDTTATIDMGYTTASAASHTDRTIQQALTGTSAWGSADSKPWETLEKLANQIRDHSDYGGALDVLLGFDAWLAFLNHEKAVQLLDSQNLNIGQVAPVATALFKGTFNGMRLWQYSNGYLNSSDTRVQAWDGKKIAVIPAGGSGEMTIEHGAVFDRLDGRQSQPTYIQTDYFSKIVSDEQDPPLDELIVESRPLALVKSPKAIRIQQVVV